MRRHEVPAELSRPFRVAAGLESVSRRTVDGPRYRRMGHGVRAPADLVMDHGEAIRGARSRLGDGPVLIGTSAAWALGARLADPEDPVNILVGSGVRRQQWVAPYRGTVDRSSVIMTPLGPATAPARTALDLARGFGASRPMTDQQRVACVDALIHSTALTAARARQAVASASRLHGLETARRVIDAVVDGAESVKETELRLLVVANGFPPPVVQHVVRAAGGRFVARLDLSWPDRRVGLEYDGAQHREFTRHSRDLARHNRLRVLGWTVLQVDARSLADPVEFLAELDTLLSR